MFNKNSNWKRRRQLSKRQNMAMENEAMKNELTKLGYKNQQSEMKKKIAENDRIADSYKQDAAARREAERHQRRMNKAAENVEKWEGKKLKYEAKNIKARNKRLKGLTSDEYKQKLKTGTITKTVGMLTGKAAVDSGNSIVKALQQETRTKENPSNEDPDTPTGPYVPSPNPTYSI